MLFGRKALSGLTLMVLLPLIAAPRAHALPTAVISLFAGAAYDQETGESSPARGTVGLQVAYGSLVATSVVDCGFPWEPSLRMAADLSVLDVDAVRLVAVSGLSLRRYGSTALEAGFRLGAHAEIGPRNIAFSGAVGLSYLSTTYTAINDTLADWNPWARVGVLARPVAQAEIELDMATDSPLSLWARTSFELRGAWEFPSAVRLAGLVAIHYGDFFTLTACVDGFEARLECFLPLTGTSK